MKTANGVKVVFSPATAYTVQNILKEWVIEHTPVDAYMDRVYGTCAEGYREASRSLLIDRLTRVIAALEQLEDKA